MASTSNNGTCYQIDGPERADTIVLIHGLGLNRHIWKDYIPALAKDYRVISYDLYGHGKSAPPPRMPDLTVYSEQIIGLIDELGIDRVALVGFSLGGMINRRLAMDYGNRVTALVIFNSPHERTPQAQALVEERAADTASGGPAATIDATIKRWFTADFIQTNQANIQSIRDRVMANDPTLYTQCRWVLATGVIELIDPQPPIMHPTLVMTCENDSGSTPDMSRGIASEIDNAKTVIVPHLQHMGLIEEPKLFIKPTMQFLKKLMN